MHMTILKNSIKTFSYLNICYIEKDLKEGAA